jgi:hypothetical protein
VRSEEVGRQLRVVNISEETEDNQKIWNKFQDATSSISTPSYFMDLMKNETMKKLGGPNNLAWNNLVGQSHDDAKNNDKRKRKISGDTIPMVISVSDK